MKPNNEKKIELQKALGELFNRLSDSDSRKELLEACPGAMDFDKLNHIFSALYSLSSSGYHDLIDEALKNCDNKEGLLLFSKYLIRLTDRMRKR